MDPITTLAKFCFAGVVGEKYFRNFSGVIGTIVLVAITVLSFITAYQYFFVDGKVDGIYRSVVVSVQTHWLDFVTPAGQFSIDIGIILDPISVMMLLVVSFVSLMVHIFSLGYMKGEQRFATYYAFLSLFTFSMLGLVMSSNIFQLYIFWELVGISSYLLI